MMGLDTLVALVMGAAAAAALMQLTGRRKSEQVSAARAQAEGEAARVLEEARREADAIRREADLQVKDLVLKAREEQERLAREQQREHAAEEKRIAVAWPMPRLAPVRSSVRRGWLVCGSAMRQGLWIEPGLHPGVVRRTAPVLDPVVQPERPILPEFDCRRDETEARPMLRPRHRSQRVSGGVARANERPRLAAEPFLITTNRA